ncbi:hypothetical protein [Chryseobacterium caseinilyticum]|uniref:DegT/DnrJ/EryC1/StrS aminotransferase family protein n=1 Tax=Chryseobacterium caseinilyticum TaxID=2771428 RepID=A0ABR8ZAQ3_9FLAO|nr:hypothetical protein [Chryseobacterium caseinilyticum]MBD8082327.1 hypothetical protein [Chryseobacterium caseinilyticum]
MKAIGGYFELEISVDKEYHHDLLRLNTARNALEYLLKAQGFKKVYIPYFTCDVILEPFYKLDIAFEFYRVNSDFEPIFDFDIIKDDQAFLYTNYFGLKDAYIQSNYSSIKNLIVDNAQSFFSKPLNHVHTFYSPRKFFGVSDGAYLATDHKLSERPDADFSNERMSHLLIRADKEAEDGYQDFCLNDQELSGNAVKTMSALTRKIMCSIDYEKVKWVRRQNFEWLHTNLSDKNKLTFNIGDDSVPMVYPFWTDNKALKKELLNNRIYCATYWPNVLKWCNPETLEAKLTEEVIYLPVDQRYTVDDMNRILKIINRGI